MTAEEAIIGRYLKGGSLFDEDEAAEIIRRLGAAGYEIVKIVELERRPFVLREE
jgi:hypothetical protein